MRRYDTHICSPHQRINDQMSVDARRGMAHNKPYGLLDHIRRVARDDKSNTGNKEGKETAEYQRWKQGKWHQFWALPAAMRCHALCILICIYLLLSRNGIIHPNPNCWSRGTQLSNKSVTVEPIRIARNRRRNPIYHLTRSHPRSRAVLGALVLFRSHPSPRYAGLLSLIYACMRASLFPCS